MDRQHVKVPTKAENVDRTQVPAAVDGKQEGVQSDKSEIGRNPNGAVCEDCA